VTIGIAAPRPVRDEYGPTSALAEAQLFEGYSPRVVSEACACGGTIACLDTTETIRIAVDAHNATPGHVAWRVRHG
jgi:hypothetical protein